MTVSYKCLAQLVLVLFFQFTVPYTNLIAGDIQYLFYFGDNEGSVSRRMLLNKTKKNLPINNISGNSIIPSLYTCMLNDQALCDLVYEYLEESREREEMPDPLMPEILFRWFGKFTGTRKKLGELRGEEKSAYMLQTIKNIEENLYTLDVYTETAVKIPRDVLYQDRDRTFFQLCNLLQAEIGDHKFRDYFPIYKEIAISPHGTDDSLKKIVLEEMNRFNKAPPFCSQEAFAEALFFMDYKYPHAVIKNRLIDNIDEYLNGYEISAEFKKFIKLLSVSGSVKFSQYQNNYNVKGTRSCFVLGSERNDVLIGSCDDDYLHGKGGDDILLGGKGNDVICGRAGNDVYVYRSGDGHDTIRELQSYEGDINTVLLVDFVLSDVIFEIENDTLSMRFNDGGQIDILTWTLYEERQIQRVIFKSGEIYSLVDIEQSLQK